MGCLIVKCAKIFDNMAKMWCFDKKFLKFSFEIQKKKKKKICTAIIDCTEIYLERPLNLETSAQTWSNYKNTNSIKYLIAITPAGAADFLSRG